MSRKKTTIINNSPFVTNINILVDKAGGKYDFADKIGVSYDAVRQWCIGENLPDGKRLLSISEKFGVSLDWLLTGKDAGAKFMATWPEDIVRACRDLKELIESNDAAILPALQTGLVAFRESVRRKADYDSLKKRLDSVEKKLKYIEKLRDRSLEGSSGTD
jgi:transcriptional regulator with XRE-family HTH domain